MDQLLMFAQALVFVEDIYPITLLEYVAQKLRQHYSSRFALLNRPLMVFRARAQLW